MKTFLVPLDGATTVSPDQHNAGCGSFQAKWTLPNGGSLLGKDLLWETRVRYVTPPYFWFAIWTAGNKWDGGGEMDTVESFGFDNGGGYTNYDGSQWHSNSVGGHDNVNYDNWGSGMASAGITDFDAGQYHVWQWAYNRDDTYQDHRPCRRGARRGPAFSQRRSARPCLQGGRRECRPEWRRLRRPGRMGHLAWPKGPDQ